MAVALLAALAVGCDALAGGLGLPFPGALLAIFLLGLRFRWRGGPDPQLADLFDATIRFWPLVFVPAGVGVIDLGGTLRESWLPILISVIGGTLLTILLTGLLAQHLLARRPRRPAARADALRAGRPAGCPLAADNEVCAARERQEA
ncbi:MAG: CidA/LrgA family protein [Limimaricola sp.]|uniref:CidA/LrgA family protein n=1 Tax=Limimaricola sp. TaxID=2211665 RepID=UPI001DF394DD|nr:CidA/LrgA family protein [Limimaricola sp.]MBI1416210.1 CidA/LrgA family protein [Limimaricola sp.]